MADAEMASLLTAEPTSGAGRSHPPGGGGGGSFAAVGASAGSGRLWLRPPRCWWLSRWFWAAALRRHRSHAWPWTRAGRNRPAALARWKLPAPMAMASSPRGETGRCRSPMAPMTLSPRGAPVRPGDEGSAVPADPSGPGRPESLGRTGRPNPRSSCRPARPRRCCDSLLWCTASDWHRPRWQPRVSLRPTSRSWRHRHQAARDRPARPGRDLRDEEKENAMTRRRLFPIAVAAALLAVPARGQAQDPPKAEATKAETRRRPPGPGHDPAGPARDHPLPGRQEAGEPPVHRSW